MKNIRRPLFALVSLLSFCALPVLAGTVTTLNDDGPGSFRAAALAGGDIDFAVTGTIILTSGEVVLNHSEHVTGPGANQLTIARNNGGDTPEFRLLNVQGVTTFSGITLRNGRIGTADGYTDGGGVLVQNRLTLRNCAVVGNTSV